MTPTIRVTYSVQAIATPDAVERAKALARLEGWEVVTLFTVVRVAAGWDVTLYVRRKGLAA